MISLSHGLHPSRPSFNTRDLCRPEVREESKASEAISEIKYRIVQLCMDSVQHLLAVSGTIYLNFSNIIISIEFALNILLLNFSPYILPYLT